MRALLCLFLVACLSASCGGETAPPVISGTVDGFVVVTGPVEGAVVTAFGYDPATGDRGDQVAVSEPSGIDGAFHIDLVDHFGPVLLVASGGGAAYVEPASGIDVVWDSQTELLAAYVTKDAAGVLSFERTRGNDSAGFVISPWSTLGVAYADGSNLPYLEALTAVHEQLEDHLGVEFWSVNPTDLTDGLVGAWNENVQFGAELAGWSQFALRLAEASDLSAAAITSLDLLEQMRRDIGDGHFDGKGASSAQLVLGTCTGCDPATEECPCTLGRCTLRGLFAEGISEFVNSDRNESGVGTTDVEDLTARITEVCAATCDRSDIWEQGSCLGDTQPPTVIIEGLGAGDVTGSVAITIWLEDSKRLSEQYLPDTTSTAKIEFVRGSDPDGDALEVTDFRTEPETEVIDPQHQKITFTLHSDELPDAPYILRVTAYDVAPTPHATTALAPFIANNSDLGTISGVVAVSGRVAGARVSVYEFDEQVKGDLLGTDVTSADGGYTVVVQPTLQSTLLLEVDNVPGEDPATYVELSTNTTITFGSSDRLRSVVTLWEDGRVRDDGMITPYTHLASAFAHALYAFEPVDDNLPPATQFAAKVARAFSLIEEHFNDGNTLIRFRSSVPFNFATWDHEGALILTDGVRYALILAGLSELAADHAEKSGSTPATMNTLTLATKLALDLGSNYSDMESLVPLWDGKAPSGAINHGLVVLDSYTTRLALAVMIGAYVNREQLFGLMEIAPLLDRMCMDSRPELYPITEPGSPFDTEVPTVAWDATVPADGTVLRGIVELKAVANDNVALQSATFVFTGEAAAQVTDAMVFVGDSTPQGPWTLTGKLNTEGLAEGSRSITVSVKDKVNATPATKTRTFIVDRKPPVATIDQAVLPGGGTLAPSAITGAASITLKGTAKDDHFLSASYSVNNGPAMPLSTPAAGGAWSTTVNLVNGDNKIVVSAKDKAGNVGSSAMVNYRRDAVAPSTSLQAGTEIWKDDKATIGASTTPGGMSVSYTQLGTTSFVDGVSFTRFASNMVPGNAGVPKVDFVVVDDNDSTGATVNLKVRLRRGASIIRDWQDVSVVSGNTRSEFLNSVLHKDLALYSDTFALDYQATDVYGNTSAVQSLSWAQTIKAPPIRQRVGAACSSSQAACPNAYSFAANNVHTLINGGAAIPGNKLRVAQAFVDNPTTVPVRVKFSSMASASYSVGAKYEATDVTGKPVLSGPACSNGTKTHLVPQGTCYTVPSTTETTKLNQTASNFFADFEVLGATPIVILDAVVEWEIAPKSTATVYVRANPFQFLWAWLMTSVPPAETSVGTITNKTGRQVQRFRTCTNINQPPGGGEGFCTATQDRMLVQYLTRGKVTPTVTVSVQSKPAEFLLSFKAAEGENTTGFGYTNNSWSSAESPATPF